MHLYATGHTAIFQTNSQRILRNLIPEYPSLFSKFKEYLLKAHLHLQNMDVDVSLKVLCKLNIAIVTEHSSPQLPPTPPTGHPDPQLILQAPQLAFHLVIPPPRAFIGKFMSSGPKGADNLWYHKGKS